MMEVEFLQNIHQSTKRDYLARMDKEKPDCMKIAKLYGDLYWDGERHFGYGGMTYDGRYASVAKKMIEHYGLKSNDTILDIGCGKGFLLYEMHRQMDSDNCIGIDISSYAIINSKYTNVAGLVTNPSFFNMDCRQIRFSEPFDLTYSINVFHNLGYKDLKSAIREMVRVTKPEGNSYICVESYRNEEELTNLQCWQLTCQSYYSPDDWKEILTGNGYKGDVEFIYFT